VCFIIVIFTWMFFPPRLGDGATAVLNTLVGTLGSLTAMIITFYFGSSRGAANKDATIAALSGLPAPAAAATTSAAGPAAQPLTPPAAPTPTPTPTG
jgi:hypothetical protein